MYCGRKFSESLSFRIFWKSFFFLLHLSDKLSDMKYVTIALCLFAIGCGEKSESESSSVSFKFPVSNNQLGISQSFMNADSDSSFLEDSTTWRLADPVNSRDINCFVVLVGADSPGLKGSSCSFASTKAPISVGVLKGGVWAGKEINLSVAAGLKRNFYLVGFVAESELYCQNFNVVDPDEQHLSNPYLLGQASADLLPGRTTDVEIALTIRPENKIQDCYGPLFDHIGDDSQFNSPIYFGDGSDGSLSTNVPTDLQAEIGAKGVPLVSFNDLVAADSGISGAQLLDVELATSWTPNILLGDVAMLYITANSQNGSTYEFSSYNSSTLGRSARGSDRIDENKNMVTIGTRVLYHQKSLDYGKEIAATQGTAASNMVYDLKPGAASSNPSNLIFVEGTPQGDLAFFWADDGGALGRELYAIGASGPPYLIGNINPGAASSYPGFDSKFFLFSGNVYFYAKGASGTEIYKTNGSAGNFELLADVNTSPNQDHLAEYNWIGSDGSKLYFVLFGSTAAMKLWHSTGALGNYAPVTGGTYGNPENIYSDPSSGQIFVKMQVSGVGYELYTVSAGNFSLYQDIYSSSTSVLDGEFHPLIKIPSSSTLLFYAENASSGLELWKLNGSAGDAALVKDINSGVSGSYSSQKPVWDSTSSQMFFVANDGLTGHELWRTDGTTAGTVLAADIELGAIGSNPENLIVAGSKVFFWALKNGQKQLFAYNIASNTLDQISNHTQSPFSFPIAKLGGEIFTQSYNPNHNSCGQSLSVGDSTLATVELKDTTGRFLTLRPKKQKFLNLDDSVFLGNSLVGSGAIESFCRVQIIRVPQLSSLNLNSGGRLYLGGSSPLDHSSSTLSGGVMPLLISEDFNVSGTGVSEIDLSGMGFSGASGGDQVGDGHYGKSISGIQSLGNGGGSDGMCGSGGGHAKLGAGPEGGISMGTEYGCGALGDPEKNCLFDKFFLGGGGGANSSSVIGDGGGALRLYAKNLKIENGAQLILRSGGVSSNEVSGFHSGSGAGGSLLARFLKIDNQGQFIFDATGGANAAAGNCTTSDGAGSGGRLHLDVIFDYLGAPAVVFPAVAPVSDPSCRKTGFANIDC